MNVYILTAQTFDGGSITWGVYLDETLAQTHGERLIKREYIYNFSIEKTELILK